MHGPLGHTLSALPNSERTPPVYYLLAWVWSRIFGTHEFGLRSLSAVAGTITVVLAYAIAKRVAGDRAGLIAAAVTAVSSILVWYSQQARLYELLVCLCAASVWLWQRATAHTSRFRIVVWGAVGCRDRHALLRVLHRLA
jgi:mannosyltransferase